MILETDLSFSSHVKAVTKSAYYHLKNIARIRCFVSSQVLEKHVRAFITSRVDYCNGLLTSCPKKTVRQLQLIQNAAARILTRTRKSEHITPVLGPYTGFQLHLGLILKYFYSFINHTEEEHFLFVTYTIIQNITSSEICALHLTHPSEHTPGEVGSQCCGTQGAVGGSVPCSRVSPQSWY